jgi:transcriptional regulator with XRE-family HTH domain
MSSVPQADESVAHQQEEVVHRQPRTLRTFIGAAFRKCREKREFTRTELAERSGFSTAEISNLENGDPASLNFTLGMLERIAFAMDHTMEMTPLPPYDRSTLQIRAFIIYAVTVKKNTALRITLHDNKSPEPLTA